MSAQYLYFLDCVSSGDDSRKELLFGDTEVDNLSMCKQHSQRLVNDLQMVSFHAMIHKEIDPLQALLVSVQN